jgi:hypothetical protein
VKTEDLRDPPWPLTLFLGSIYLLATIRDAVFFLLLLGVAIACLVVGSTTGRYVGAVLLLGWLLVAYRIARRQLVRRAAHRA